jgi:hypothetical protein
MERLEDRLALAVLLTYEAGVGLSLVEQASGATPTVTIGEDVAGQLWIQLVGSNFHAQSTAQGSQQAPGLTYENGTPESSTLAILDISADFWRNQTTNNVALRTNLAGDLLLLGPITNAAGILSSISASAAIINVGDVDMSHPNVITGQVNGDVDLRAAGALMANQTIITGAGTISLAAGVNDNGTASSGGGILSIAASATVMSEDPSNAITLRGGDIAIDSSSNPAKVVSPVGVVFRTAQAGGAISVGANPNTGLAVSNLELTQIATSGTITFGDNSYSGTITFASASTPGPGIVAQTTGPGSIVLDSTAGTALSAGGARVHLLAGTGGIVAAGGATTPSIATSGQVLLDASGGIGGSTARVRCRAHQPPQEHGRVGQRGAVRHGKGPGDNLDREYG